MFTFSQQNVRRRAPYYIYIYKNIIWPPSSNNQRPTSSLIPQNKDNLSVYNIRKLYWATLFSFFFKKKSNIEHALIFVICHIRVCCYHDQARGFHGALRKHSLLH